MSVQIPEELLESLEVSLEALGRNLLKDVGEVLNIPYRDLVKRVYGSGKKITLSLAPTEVATPSTCKAIVQHSSGGFFCGSCPQPGSRFCQTHYEKPQLFDTKNAIPLRQIRGIDTTETLWATPQGHVLNKQGQIRGAIKNGILYKYSL
jgi:hypothetical protein